MKQPLRVGAYTVRTCEHLQAVARVRCLVTSVLFCSFVQIALIFARAEAGVIIQGLIG